MFDYNPNTQGEANMARALRSELGTVLRPSFTSTYPRFTYAGGAGSLSGSAAINSVLVPIVSGTTPSHLGRLAAIASAAILVIAFNFRKAAAKFASVYPPIGLVLATGLTSNCATCAPGAGFSVYAPIATILYLFWGAALFTLPLIRHRTIFAIYGLTSAMIPLVQATLLLREPKLCPICLATTFLSALLMHSTIESVRQGANVSIALPAVVRGSVAVGAVALVALHASLLTGTLRSTPATAAKLGPLVGTKASALIQHTGGTTLGGRLLMLTAPECGACALAKAGLPSTGLQAVDVPPCGTFTSGPCYNVGRRAVLTPTFLVCDRNGKIVTQYVGWPSSPSDLDAFERQVGPSVRSLK